MFQQLSDTELMIMEYLWSQKNTPKTFSEIKAFLKPPQKQKLEKTDAEHISTRLVKKGGFIRQPSSKKSLIIRHYLRKNITNNILLR